MAITKSKTLNIDYFSYIKAFFNLMKPRVMSLVIFTCAVGLLIAIASATQDITVDALRIEQIGEQEHPPYFLYLY